MRLKTKRRILEEKRFAQFQNMEFEGMRHTVFFERLRKKQVLESARLETKRKPGEYIR